MPRLIALLAAIALAGLVGVAALNAAGPRAFAPPAATPLPTASPVSTPMPTPVPTPVPVVSPTPAPSKVPTGGLQLNVELENVLGQDVSIDVVDRSGHLTGAASGQPREGASVDWNDVQVENVGPATIRLTFTDMPGSAALGLIIDEDGRHLLLVRPSRDGDTIAFDRVLELTFDAPVAADQLQVAIQEGQDT
jgi:hypothetical protein